MHSGKSKYRDDLSKCVRCGGCKAFCPTYGTDPQEALGARGRVTLLREMFAGNLNPSRLLNDRIFSCILCGACSGTCPLGVDIPEAIYRGRAFLSRTDRQRKYLRALVRFSARWPDMAFKIARFGQLLFFPFLANKGIIPFNPELPETPLRRLDQVFKPPKKKGRVAVFTGCSVNYVFPHLGESLINILQRIGYEVVLPQGETCCGAPLRALGLEKQAEEQAKKNYRVFSRLKVEAILSLCPTCTLTIRTEYPKMIGKGLERAMDISVFFSDKLDSADSIRKTVFYHDPCHLFYGLDVKKEPREIIKKAGLDLVEQADQGCCGFGGLFCISYRDLSEDLLKARTSAILASGADTVVTACPGCMLQLSRTISDRPVLHLVELIEEAFCFRADEARAEEQEKEPMLF